MCYSACLNLPKSKYFHSALFVLIKRDPPVNFRLCSPCSDDPNGTFPNTKLVLQELDIPRFNSDDCRHVQQVCWQVSQRAAYLAATGE